LALKEVYSVEKNSGEKNECAETGVSGDGDKFRYLENLKYLNRMKMEREASCHSKIVYYEKEPVSWKQKTINKIID
jgi:hypothetical protein